MWSLDYPLCFSIDNLLITQDWKVHLWTVLHAFTLVIYGRSWRARKKFESSF